ncbi:hypothetical protein PG990_008135 [Apiospora arundinis]
MESNLSLSRMVKDCQARFYACLDIPALSEDDWLEQKFAIFNWWNSALNADKSDHSSLEYRVSLRPDVKAEIMKLLEGLITALSECEDIDSKAAFSTTRSPPGEDSGMLIHTSGVDMEMCHPEPDLEGSQDGSGTDSLSLDDELEDPSDPYTEQRFYMDTFLDLLVGIQRTINRSGLKFRNKRADDALAETDEEFQRLKDTFGDNKALNHPETGLHERFRRYLTKLVLLSRGYYNALIGRLENDLSSYAFEHGGYLSQGALEKTKVLIIMRAYLHDDARLTPVQRRLIEANVTRRNRFIHAKRTTKRDRESPCAQDSLSLDREMKKAKIETWVVEDDQPASSEQEAPKPDQPPPEVAGEGGRTTNENVKVRTVTQLGSNFTMGGIMRMDMGSKRAKSAVTKMSARINHLDYPICPAQSGSFECPLCPELLPKEYTQRERWRAHVAQDLNPYVCVFDECPTSDTLYTTTYEWMSHMTIHHAAFQFSCQICSKAPDTPSFFEEQSEWVDHMLKEHQIGANHPDFALHLDASSEMTGIQKVRCPLCENKSGLTTLGKGDEPQEACSSLELGFVQLEEDEHIANHIHEFALQSLPWDVAEFDASAASNNCVSDLTSSHATKSEPSSGSDDSMLIKRWYSDEEVLQAREDAITKLKEIDQNNPSLRKLSCDVVSYIKKATLLDSDGKDLDEEGLLVILNELRQYELSSTQSLSEEERLESEKQLHDLLERSGVRLLNMLQFEAPGPFNGQGTPDAVEKQAWYSLYFISIADSPYSGEKDPREVKKNPKQDETIRSADTVIQDLYHKIYDTSEFTDWLRFGSGIFWVDGAPRSGKTKLMDNIIQDHRTQMALQAWAGSSQFVIAKSFVWNDSETSIFRTLKRYGHGLEFYRKPATILQRLLYQVLARLPALGRITSAIWRRPEHPSRSSLVFPDFQTIKKMLLSAIQSQTTTTKFCFFIDGVEHLCGDHHGFLGFLQDVKGVPNVKVYVSGRPKIDPEAVFLGCPRIIMHELVRKWLESRTIKELEVAPSSNGVADFPQSQLACLAARIVERGRTNGWWIRVANQYHMNAIKTGITPAELEKHVDDMPRDPTGLYKYILKQIAPKNRAAAAFYLLVFVAIGRVQPVAIYEMAARLLDEPHCAISGLPEATHGYGDRIALVTAGLLVPEEADRDDANARFRKKINTIHTDVLTFLRRPKVLWNLKRWVSGLCVESLLCRATLAYIKAVRMQLDELARFTKDVLQFASIWQRDDPPVDCEVLHDLERTIVRKYDDVFDVAPRYCWSDLTMDQASPNIWDERGDKTFLAVAIERGLTPYVDEIARTRPEELFLKKGIPYLDYALYYSKVNIQIVEILLRAGLDPNEDTPAHGAGGQAIFGSVWSLFLRSLLKKQNTTEDEDRTMELLLQFGADKDAKEQFDLRMPRKEAEAASAQQVLPP